MTTYEIEIIPNAETVSYNYTTDYEQVLDLLISASDLELPVRVLDTETGEVLAVQNREELYDEDNYLSTETAIAIFERFLAEQWG